MAELLSGIAQPLSALEFTYWCAYYKYVTELEKEAEEKAKKAAKR